jgi:hypothetical protein
MIADCAGHFRRIGDIHGSTIEPAAAPRAMTISAWPTWPLAPKTKIF